MFDLVGQIWDAAIVSPMTSALLLLFDMLAGGGIVSWGITIIVFTLIVKTLTLPLTVQQLRSAKAMQALQPELEALKREHGKDREKLMQAQMALYRERGVNPMAGCVPMLIQMPIWIGLYSALLSEAVSQHPAFGNGFLWLPSLAQPDPWFILAALSGITGYLAQKAMVTQTTDPQQQQMMAMMQFMPIMYVVFALQVPAGLVLYWVVSNLYTFLQQGSMIGWKNINWGLTPFTPAAQAAQASRSRITPAAASAPTPTRRELVAAKANGHSPESVAETTPVTPKRKKRRR